MGGRVSCRRTRSLRCSKCYEHGLVKVTGENGNSFTCRCETCGHTYQTTSAAARRAWRYREKRI